MAENLLFYGDNLDILRRYVKDGTVGLIYLDPPFNSNQDYNVLFREQSGTPSAAQIRAFEDTWVWNEDAQRAYEEVVEQGGRPAEAMRAFRTFLGSSNMMAYLSMMAPRLVELRRVLKATGSIYLHCDPTASHYLKMLMDAVFGPENFRNEIIWKRTSSHNDARKFADVCDYILYFARAKAATWNAQHQTHNQKYLRSHYNRTTADGRVYRLDNIIRSASMGPRPNLVYEYRGFTPPWGWRVVLPKLKALDEAGRLMWSKGRQGTTTPYLVRFLDEQSGAAMPALWDDIAPINSQAQERLGYPTQKPEALLERIITASSNEGDTVLDPFCGCGTAIAVAQRLGRKWIGIDVTHLAITLIKHRLRDAFGDSVSYDVIGEPVSSPDAQALAAQDPYQFQWWALGLVGARPADQKKGADRGIDGRLYFHDEGESGRTKQIILSVKAGNVTVAHVRDLRGVVDREQAEIGVLLCMEEPTKQMKAEAAGAGFYFSPGWSTKHPRLQVLTVTELLEGKRIDYPPSRQVNVTFKKAPKAEREEDIEQLPLVAEEKATYRTTEPPGKKLHRRPAPEVPRRKRTSH